MGANDGSGSNLDIRAYDAEGADTDALRNTREVIDERRGMNQALFSAAAHMISALATNSPSTSARHSNAQILRLWRK